MRTPFLFPLRWTYRIIAPYWADVDTRRSGRIFYRQTSDPNLLAKAASDIRRGFPLSQNVSISNLLIATWDAVGYYDNNGDKVFLIIIAMYVRTYSTSSVLKVL